MPFTESGWADTDAASQGSASKAPAPIHRASFILRPAPPSRPSIAVPGWVVIGCYVAMGLGTLSGGWKIIETMGSRITKLSHHQGFCASMGGSLLLFGATAFGIPVSTTHTITGCIMGVGAAKRTSAVRWGVAQRLVVAWLVTIPAAALVGAAFYEIAVLIDRAL